MDILIIAALVLGSLCVGLVVGLGVKRIADIRKKNVAISEAELILDQAREEQRKIVLEAKEEALQNRREGESELRERRSELRNLERRVESREENVEGRAKNLDKRERRNVEREKEIEIIAAEVETLQNSKVQELEKIADLTVDEAKDIVIREAEDDAKHELTVRYRNLEEEARNEANEKARFILSQSIQRLASDVVSEVTVSTVPIPSDDMKGRLIGREGRNIRSIEKNTGVDLIIDDTPEAVTLSCFDPVRREVARMAIMKLVADGRIHPARIEDMVSKSQKEVEEAIWKHGEAAVIET